MKSIYFLALFLAFAFQANSISARQQKDDSILLGNELISQYSKEPMSTSRDLVSPKKILNELRMGGFIIYFRHATTERDYADQADPRMNLRDCNTQRKISLQGIKESYMIGSVFAEKKIPVGNVIASEYCRAWKTANYAFGRVDEKDSRLNFLPYEDYSTDLISLMKANITPILSKPPSPGTNTVIVGHDDPFEAATGIYPEPQGIAYIIKPVNGTSFRIITKLLPSEWQDL